MCRAQFTFEITWLGDERSGLFDSGVNVHGNFACVLVDMLLFFLPMPRVRCDRILKKMFGEFNIRPIQKHISSYNRII